MSDDIDEMFRDASLRRSFTEREGRPLAKAEAEALPALPRAMKDYRPYGYVAGEGASEGCTLFTWMDGTTIPIGGDFPWRLYMGTDFHDETELRILLPHRTILILGQKLAELHHRLCRRAVNFIQQHHPGIWPMPQDAPYVSRIEFLGPGHAKSANKSD